MGMLAPLLCAAGLYWSARNFHLSRCHSFLAASLAWGVITLAITELLSAFHALMWWPLLISWITATLAVVVAGTLAAQPQSNRPSNVMQTDEPGTVTVGQRIAVVLLVCLLGVIGVCSAPVNSDSMAYHLPRVMHWMVHHSVRHYATGNVTQLYHSPWAEFAILHFQILTDGDRFASSIQWMAMLVCLVGVYVLTGQIAGGRSRAQSVAVVFTVTIPNTILQAVSTQNNLVVSAWLIVAAVMLLAFRESVLLRTTQRRRSIVLAAGFGFAIGLALLTKGTAYLYAIPLLAWFAAINLRYARRMSALLMLVAAVTAASLNAGHWARNYSWCQSPLMPADQAEIFHTQHVGPLLVAANIINNVAVELRTGVPWLDYPIWRTAVSLQSALGVSGSDLRIALAGHSLRVLPSRGTNEDVAGNPVHIIVLACIFAVILIRAVTHGQRDDQFILALVVLAGFALFCILIRWQMFHCRLHLPLLMLSAPLVAITLSRFCDARQLRSALWALLLLAAFTVAANAGHPLFGRNSIFITSRESQYFTLRPTLYEPYKRATDALARRHFRAIGITSGPVWEYPLWIMLRSREGQWPDIQSVTPALPTPDGTRPNPSRFSAVIVLPRRHGSEESFPPPLGWPTQQVGHGMQLMIKPRTN